MDIPIKVDKDFERELDHLKYKYGEDFEYLNGFHETQLNFSDFIDGFIDKKVADMTIDANANASNKDIKSMMNEKGKPQDKLFGFQKIFYELKKKYNLETARQWLETEYNGGFYLHDAFSATYVPYCFVGATKIMTDQGFRRLDECVNKDIRTLNIDHVWEDSTVKYFGKAPIMELCLERYGVKKYLYTTPNHKWFVTNKKKTEINILTTEELEKGDRIPFNCGKPWRKTPVGLGIAHGFYIGDGSKGKNTRVSFCGDKKEIIKYYPTQYYYIDKHRGDAHMSRGIPNYFKELPPLTEDKDYLYSWIAGYFAADGSVDTRGRATMTSVKPEYLERVRDIFCILGLPVSDLRYQDRVSNLTHEMGRVYILTLSTEFLSDSFFIRPTHYKRILKYRRTENKNRTWIVVSVEFTDLVEDIYCVIAPESESFTLEGNILTHNCHN